MCDSSQSASHNSDHSYVQPSLGVFSFDFVVTNQPAMFHKPAEGPFYDPSSGQHRKAALAFISRHDLHAERAGFAMRGHPLRKLFSAIALVSPDAPHPAKADQ